MHFTWFNSVLVLLLLKYIESSGKVSFEDESVLKVTVKKANEIDLLSSLTLSSSIDLWSDFQQPNLTNASLVLSVKSAEKTAVIQSFNRWNIKYEILTENLQEWINEEENQITEKDNNSDFDYENYHTYDEIINQLEWLAKKYPERSVYGSMGETVENRLIPFFVVKSEEAMAPKSVVIECGIHARERISPATCLWVINELLTNTETGKLLNTYTFHILPLVNPDGYTYTWTNNRLWRKNRSKHQLSWVGYCYGVDLNRNFDFHFGSKGTKSWPCDNHYSGPRAFSEKETQAIRDYTKNLSDQGTLHVYFSVHSYSQVWFYPSGLKSKPVYNKKRLNELSKIAASAIKETHGKVYATGDIASLFGEVSGSSIDWIYDNTRSKLAFGTELRDNGYHKFLLPPDQIKATAEEYWNGVNALLDAIKSDV